MVVVVVIGIVPGDDWSELRGASDMPLDLQDQRPPVIEDDAEEIGDETRERRRTEVEEPGPRAIEEARETERKEGEGHARAEALLNSLLTPVQHQLYKEKGYFDLTVREGEERGERTVRLRQGSSQNQNINDLVLDRIVHPTPRT